MKVPDAKMSKRGPTKEGNITEKLKRRRPTQGRSNEKKTKKPAGMGGEAKGPAGGCVMRQR